MLCMKDICSISQKRWTYSLQERVRDSMLGAIGVPLYPVMDTPVSLEWKSWTMTVSCQLGKRRLSATKFGADVRRRTRYTFSKYFKKNLGLISGFFSSSVWEAVQWMVDLKRMQLNMCTITRKQSKRLNLSNPLELPIPYLPFPSKFPTGLRLAHREFTQLGILLSTWVELLSPQLNVMIDSNFVGGFKGAKC